MMDNIFKSEPKNYSITIRITKLQRDYITKRKLNSTAIFSNAINMLINQELMIKGRK